VVKSLPAGSIAVGTPAETQREFLTRLNLPKKLEKLQAKIEALTAELEALKANQQ
jgi:UDP-3-O-[3-hydroxymyristoyl] glucosamine N-acyltransferase